jgi:hypothetical protein
MQHFSSDLYPMVVFDLTCSDLIALPVGDSKDNLGTKAVAGQAFVWSLKSQAGFILHQNLLHCVLVEE